MKRPTRFSKQSKVIDRKFKETKCKECTVVVTRMDFAKILGKFTKVKIQYETSSSPKKEKEKNVTSPNPNSRLKRNENGMVLIHRNAYSEHPVKNLSTPKKKVANLKQKSETIVNSKLNSRPIRQLNNNILKENNRIKKSPNQKEAKSKSLKKTNITLKHYGIIFENPKMKHNDGRNQISLVDLISKIDKAILPSDEWTLEYFPKDELQNDIVYDKIAAELEDLMYNSKTAKINEKDGKGQDKMDDFPSILDIINEPINPKDDHVNSSDGLTSNSDIEAMLLGKPESEKNASKDQNIEPRSPSILDESQDDVSQDSKSETKSKDILSEITDTKTETDDVDNSKNEKQKRNSVTHIVFKDITNTDCHKVVTCTKNLKFNIELAGKPVELLGAPKSVSCLDDLRILLQIVHESKLESCYVFHS